MDDLIEMVSRQAGISAAQATLAVNSLLAFLAARLPSPVVGRIREQLHEAKALRDEDMQDGPTG